MPPPVQITGTQSSAATVALLPHQLLPSSRLRLRELGSQLLTPLLLLFSVLLLGTAGYYILGGGAFSLLDSLYMTSVTLTTVGYGEVVAIQEHAHRDLLVAYTIGLMWVGMGVTLYAISKVTAFIVENNLGYLLKGRKMLKEIEALKGHIILCGLGRTGSHTAAEFMRTKTPFVVIESDPTAIELWQAIHPEHAKGLLYLVGDGADEHTLIHAGIERAEGLITTLKGDAENMLVVVSAKYINRELRVISKVVDPQFADRLRKVGAEGIVNPSFIGGMRLASEMIRPNVVTFLDHMLRSKDGGVRVSELTVQEHSQVWNTKLRNSGITEKTGMIVIALRKPEGEYIYNPSSDLHLVAGMVLVVIGGPEAINKLEKMVR